MKKVVLLLGATILLSACKKALQNVQENIIVDAMTSGQWKVVKLVNNSTTITPQFAEYRFQFFKNNKVDAIINNRVEQSGTWYGYIENQTIKANFTNTPAPVLFLNGVWKIDKNSWTFVEATLEGSTDVRKLRLEKL